MGHRSGVNVCMGLQVEEPTKLMEPTIDNTEVPCPNRMHDCCMHRQHTADGMPSVGPDAAGMANIVIAHIAMAYIVVARMVVAHTA